jgi:ferritin
MKKEMQDAINKQIVREMYSSNLYLSMAAYYSAMNLNGFANWMRVQAEEEMEHAMKFFDYLEDRGGKPVIGAIDAPTTDWDSALAAFENALEHEKLVTGHINDLMDLSIELKDHATTSLLQWFIDEQVEEEATTGEIVDRLKMISDSKGALFFLDNELKSRTSVG